ncbi:sulfatase [Kiritimatiella glycovorans]|uniref:Choline-sulfatase n=1 Tax=Kiritimatiella glycovorans TaxID=1307763 RepID=A0A0G3EE63_9BACT|nr:sulfatase [Kiritimatiella glycovorans]AKJ63707.1 Choline-sulfatase [Kiritimatiella glycovorans]
MTLGAPRRDLLKAALCSAALVSVGAWAQSAPRMNVVIITTDDNDAASLGCFGNPLEGVTPHMDRLAAKGARFEHAHTTSPTCQPSRLSLMTGRYPQTNGNTGHADPLKPGVTTLAAELKKAGYFTALVGKEGNYVPAEAFDWDRHRLSADQWEPDDGYWGMWRSPEGFYRGTKELIAEAKKAEKPFFLHLNTSDPHRPWPGHVTEVEHLRRMESRSGLELDPLRPCPRQYSPLEVPVPGYLPDLPGVRVDLADYYECLHRADLAVGRMLQAIEEAGARRHTIVICFGDQGMALPTSKQNIYPYSTRIPLLIDWPGVTKPGTVVGDTMVSVIDLMPTLLDGLGLPPVEGLDGKSVLPVLKGDPQAGRSRVFTSYNYALPGIQVFPMRAVQTREFIYIYNAWPGRENAQGQPLRYNGNYDALKPMAWPSMLEAAKTDPEVAERVRFIARRAPEEFYDLRSDPDCLHNRIDDPEHREKIETLRRLLMRQMEETGDPLLKVWKEDAPLPSAWMNR